MYFIVVLTVALSAVLCSTSVLTLSSLILVTIVMIMMVSSSIVMSFVMVLGCKMICSFAELP